MEGAGYGVRWWCWPEVPLTSEPVLRTEFLAGLGSATTLSGQPGRREQSTGKEGGGAPGTDVPEPFVPRVKHKILLKTGPSRAAPIPLDRLAFCHPSLPRLIRPTAFGIGAISQQ